MKTYLSKSNVCVFLFAFLTSFLIPATSISVFADSWEVYIRAEVPSASLIDRTNVFGVSQDAQNEYDAKDILDLFPMVNPTTDPWIFFYFDNSDWDAYAGSYAKDIRSDGLFEQTWKIKVGANLVEGQQVELSWSQPYTIGQTPVWDFTYIPSDWELYFVDVEDNGAKYNLRTVEKFTYTATNGYRDFQILVKNPHLPTATPTPTPAFESRWQNPEDATPNHKDFDTSSDNWTLRQNVYEYNFDSPTELEDFIIENEESVSLIDVTTNPGYLSIQSGESEPNHFGDIFTAPFIYKKIKGNFEVETLIQANHNERWETSTLMVRLSGTDGNNWVNIGVGSDGSKTYCAGWNTVNDSTTQTKSVDFSGNDIYLRIRKLEEGNILFYKNTSDGDWLRLRRDDRFDFVESGSPLDIGITQMTNNASADYLTKIDYIKYSYYPQNYPEVVFIRADAGYTVLWDMSSFKADVSAIHLVKFQYASDELGTNWNGNWLTIYQMQAQMDVYSRYFWLKATIISNGFENADLDNLYIKGMDATPTFTPTNTPTETPTETPTYTPPPSTPTPFDQADHNNDNYIDRYDLLQFSRSWQDSAEQKGDINFDGVIDQQDLLLLIELWHRTK